MTEGVDTGMQAMQPPTTLPVNDRATPQPQPHELLSRKHPVLTVGEVGNRPIPLARLRKVIPEATFRNLGGIGGCMVRHPLEVGDPRRTRGAQRVPPT